MDLLNEQTNSLINDIYGGERWFLESGIVTDSATDTLLGYAYMQKGVKKVTLKIDADKDNGIKSPKIDYAIKLSSYKKFMYNRVESLSKNNSIMSKIGILILMNLGALPPKYIETAVGTLAKNYLPPKYSVSVQVL